MLRVRDFPSAGLIPTHMHGINRTATYQQSSHLVDVPEAGFEDIRELPSRLSFWYIHDGGSRVDETDLRQGSCNLRLRVAYQDSRDLPAFPLNLGSERHSLGAAFCGGFRMRV